MLPLQPQRKTKGDSSYRKSNGRQAARVVQVHGYYRVDTGCGNVFESAQFFEKDGSKKIKQRVMKNFITAGKSSYLWYETQVREIHKNDSSEFSREYLVRFEQFIYNGEFDPGSG